MINEHDRVILTTDVPEEGLRAGDVGTVVHIYPNAAAFEVELMTVVGETISVVTLPASSVREARPNEVLSARAA